MKRFLTILAIALGLGQLSAYAQMTDKQVVEYTKRAAASGKNQNQIAKELLAKGVSPDQAERIMKNYENREENSAATAQSVDNQLSRRTESSMSMTTEEVGEHNMAEAIVASSTRPTSTIFGHDIFNSRSLTFEPNENAATPETYILGPGDQIIIDIWGYNETTIERTISPEGRITISQVGPVQLSGLTIAEASKKLKKLLASKYAGLGGSSSSVSVTLGKVRTIQVNIMGEVRTPGTYRLSSFSSVFNAIYRAGGVTNSGTIRNIRVLRAGEEVAEVDLYGYLFEGKSDSDISLLEGDIIIVPTYSRLVIIDGKVKRPMTYELADGETLQTLIDYAGGFSSDAYTEDINVIRQTGVEKEIFTVKNAEFASYAMEDGDEVSVGSNLDRFANMVEIRGYVFRPGEYQLGGDIATVKQLVSKAGGLEEDAFLGRALLLREKEDLSVETRPINIGAIIDGSAEDILLKKNDVLIISGIYELQDRGVLTINGMVANPGTFVFTDNTTIEDLILRAGGLLDGASTARVDIARRVVDPGSLTATDVIGESFSFPIKDGFAIDGGENFILEPYDVVSVRRSPGYRAQTYVEIRGAVAFPGSYQLLNKNETISELIARAGGLTNQAYAKGARLTRNNNNNTYSIVKDLVEKNSRADSVNVGALDLAEDYLVALDLEKAIENPYSDNDIKLVSGDRIMIPEYENTVRVVGEVMFANAVSYIKGKPLSFYIDAAGGYSTNAKKSKVYIVYANGSANKSLLGNVKIEPGCTIVVPSKPERKTVEAAQFSAIASAASSFTTLLAVIYNIFFR